MNFETYIPLIISILSALSGAYIIVKVSLAEIKKDISHLIESKERSESEHSENMKEVRGDVKAIFRILTKIQIDQAKSHGKNELVQELTSALVEIAKK
jgi:hypothetical protein